MFGNSAGAEVGLELAKNHPDIVEGLVVHEPPGSACCPTPTRSSASRRDLPHRVGRGPEAGFLDFLLLTQLPFNAGKPFTQPRSTPSAPTPTALPGFDFADFYVKYQMLPLTNYAPDLAAIAETTSRSWPVPVS